MKSKKPKRIMVALDDPKLHAMLKAVAKKEAMPLSQLVRRMLKAGFKGRLVWNPKP